MAALHDCLDCALFQCNTCAETNREWLHGACCCGRYGVDEDDYLEDWDDPTWDEVSA